MAKETGLGMTSFNVDNGAGVAKDIVNDITNWTINTPRGVQDVTGVDKSAMERLLLLADGQMSLSGVFNPAADQSHDVFKTVSSTSTVRTVTAVHSAQTLAMEMIASDYSLTRSADGSLVWTVQLQLADGTAPTWA
jgi:hypothetical protein